MSGDMYLYTIDRHVIEAYQFPFAGKKKMSNNYENVL